jgi:glycosyltransferase involved in cell wall biosynthesis
MKPEPKITGNLSNTLVILTPGFPKDESDSTCLPAQQLFVRALNRCYPGLRIVILAFEYPFSTQPYSWHQNGVIPFDGWNKGRIKKCRVWISAWRTLNRLKREGKLLGMLSFWCTGCALVGSWYGRQKGLKHLTWILGQDARGNNRYIPFIRPRPDELVAMSDSLVKEFERNYGVRPQYIVTNGVDTSSYPQPDGLTGRDIDVLGVGSLIPLKQYDLFLSIVRMLSAATPRIRAVICGKGPEEANLRATIRRWQLEANVELIGEQSHEEVLRLMQRSKVFLHTSSYEGFSTVCLEALYAGAHVVSLCHPMASWVNHWHIADKWEEMPELVQAVLEGPATDHQPVLVYSMEDSARKMMRLFEYGDQPSTP